ncbi:hypothetical protein [Flavobacterium sp. WC2509]|uniref:hypothetical protein n=1 Tax=Flavobacterium sp. WC2509 TaxID=3461406 RepID=UPI004044D085
MDKKEPFIFQIDSPAVLKAFETKNYCIEYNTEEKCDSNLCVIYFSSNEIYYPNTLKSFDYSIIERDKYEWKRNKHPYAGKHIFIRDIRKQWYIGGINSKLDTPLKLTDFLKKETEGFKIYTIGSSAGGFAAILFGSLLKVKRIYAFNSQLNLEVTMQSSSALVDPILFDKVKDNEVKSYFDLSNFITDSVDYYYFQSCYSKMDTDQYNSISSHSKKHLRIIRFKTSNHGFPFLRINLPYILAFDKNSLEDLVGKSFNLIFFSIRLIGFIATIQFLFKALVDRYHKKRIEASLKKK